MTKKLTYPRRVETSAYPITASSTTAECAYPQVGLSLLDQLDYLDGWTMRNIRQELEDAEDRLASARRRHGEQKAYRAELLEALIALGLARKEGSEIIVTRPERSGT